MIDLAEFAFFVAILQTLLRQKGSVPEVGNISGDPEFFSWSGRRKAVVSSFPTQTARTGLRQILRNIKLRRSACSHYISASAHLYQDNRKQNRIHLPLSLCLSLSLSVCLSLSLSLSVCLSVCLSLSLSLSVSLSFSLARWYASFLSLDLCLSVCLSVCLSLIRSHASFRSCHCKLFDLLVQVLFCWHTFVPFYRFYVVMSFYKMLQYFLSAYLLST